jgi:O-antigen/teichoic acid export membrane protein
LVDLGRLMPDEKPNGDERKKRLRRARRARSKALRPEKREHTHPGGTGAAIGAHLAKFSSFQGVSLLLTNLLHYGSLVVVASFLGPSSLGSYALLFFLTGVITQVIHVVSKPGTMMRTFGISDDDADEMDDEESEVGSVRPTYTLGVGLAWTTLLAGTIIGLIAIFQTQVASFLLHDSSQGSVVLFASITGGVWAIFKLAEMVIWFEGRPLTFALIDAARPAFNLTAIVVILAMGAGVEGAIVGQAIGTVAATLICVAAIWPSFQKVFALPELKQILVRGAPRIPIASSLWIVQNADPFILSRFLDHTQIGLYTLASRTGFMVAFLPQGFRMALRPIRKTAAYEAFRREYGIAVAQGQLLAYFYLLTLTAILAMVLGGEILIAVGGAEFESVAPLVPLTAAAMSMPAMFRTIVMTGTFKKRRRMFIWSSIFVAIAYIGLCVGLLSVTDWGIYAPPAAMIAAFTIPSVAMLAMTQFGDTPIKLPYIALSQATLVAVALAVAYHFAHPANQWLQLPTIAAVMLVWLGLLFLLRIIPEHHWGPIGHIVRSAMGRRSVLQFKKRAGLRSLDPDERDALRAAVTNRLPDATLVPATAGEDDSGNEMINPDSEGARLVRLLRRTGNNGSIPIAEESEYDAGISLYLFSDQPVAVRLRKMRQLMAAGVDAHELRTLDDLRNDLARARDSLWDLRSGSGAGRRGGKGRGDGKGVEVGAAKRA